MLNTVPPVSSDAIMLLHIQILLMTLFLDLQFHHDPRHSRADGRDVKSAVLRITESEIRDLIPICRFCGIGGHLRDIWSHFGKNICKI